VKGGKGARKKGRERRRRPRHLLRYKRTTAAILTCRGLKVGEREEEEEENEQCHSVVIPAEKAAPPAVCV
jgi:hypothetical protein